MKVLIFLFAFLFTLLCYKYPRDVESYVVVSSSGRLPTLEDVCQKILEITSSANESKIIITGRNGGLGHKSISTVEEIISALVLKKQLWCINYTYFTI